MNYVIEKYSDFKKFELWDVFLNNSKQRVFQCCEIYSAMIEAFNCQSKVRFVKIFDEEELVAVIPLMKRPFTSRLSFMDRNILDYQDILFNKDLTMERKAEVVDFICVEFTKECKLRLNSIPDDSEFLNLLQCRDDVGIEQVEICPFVEINSDWDKYWEEVPKKFRKDTERQFKKYFEGRIRLETVSRDDFYDCVDEMFEMKRQNPPEQGLSGLMSDDRYKLYVKKCYSFCENLDFVKMYYDDKVVGYVFSFSDSENYFYLIPSNVKMDKTSVGRIMLVELMKKCFKEGKKIFDFLQGDESYKLKFTSKERKLYDIYIPRRSRFELKWLELRQRIFLYWIRNWEKWYVEKIINSRLKA